MKNATHKVRIKDEIMTHSMGGERKINMKFYTLNSKPRTDGKSCISVIYNFVYPTNEVRVHLKFSRSEVIFLTL